MPLLALLILVAVALIAAYWKGLLWIALAVLAAAALPRIIRHILKKRYFASAEFLARKEQIALLVAEHNEISRYVSEIRETGSFEVGSSSTGSQSHLASSENTSHHNYRRDRNRANLQAPNVHSCSLQIVRKAEAAPIKYLQKYFNISPTEPTLAEIEALGEKISRLEEAVGNLQKREEGITKSFDPPTFILKHYNDEFLKHVGFELPSIEIPYPIYVFEYVSAGGNSSQRTTVNLNTPTIDALIESLSQTVRFKKSAAGQRALMTAKLRESIKTRDNHTCQYCSISLAAEPHLLLEVDHIIPLSKGGLSTTENLQTLCWRCNRTKSNKVSPTRASRDTR